MKPQPRYVSELTERYDHERHGLMDHYRVDTAVPFDIAMYQSRNRVIDIQVRHQARRFPRVPVQRRRREIPWAEAGKLALIFAIGIAFVLIFGRFPIVQGV